MRAIVLSTLNAVYLFGAVEQSGSILNEVAKLRQKYEECRAGQSTVLGVEPRVYEKCENKRIEAIGKLKGYQSRITNLEREIEQRNRELAAAQATISRLKNTPVKTAVHEKIVEKVVYKDRPLMQEKLKNTPLKAVAKEKTAVVKATPKASPTPSKAHLPKKGGTSAAYRISGNAPIYNAPNGSQIDTWEDRRSFTAGNPSNGWVHITGYFVNRVWTATGEGENLWVKESDVIRR